MNSPQDCYTEDAGYAYAEGYDEGYKRARTEHFPVYTVHRAWGEYEDAKDIIVFATTDLEKAKRICADFVEKEDGSAYFICQIEVNYFMYNNGLNGIETRIDDYSSLE